MSIAIRGTTPGTATSTTPTVSVTLTGARQPQPGDTLLIVHSNDWFTLADMPTPTVGGSTTGVAAILNGSADGGSNEAHLKSYTYKVTSAGDLTVSVTETSAGDEEKSLVVYVLSGEDADNPVDVASTSFDITTSASQIAPSVTPGSTTAFLICHASTGGGSSAGPYTPPGGMSETYDITIPGYSAAGAVEQLSTSNPTGARTFTATSGAHWAALAVAVRTGSAVAETNYAGPRRSPAPGRVSPTGRLQAQARGNVKPAAAALVGTASETDTALGVGRTKARTLGLAAETDTAQPFGRSKAKVLGVATETDTAQPVTAPVTTRHNLCPNPACGTDTTAWSSGGGALTPVTDITGLPVTTGIRFAYHSYVQTPTGVVSPGQQITASIHAENNTGLASTGKTVYLAFERSVGGTDFSQTTTVDYPTGTVTRASITGTAPADATGVYLILDSLNGTLGFGFDVSAVLYEVGGSLGSYFDGDTAGARWDGTPDSSTSTFGPQSAAVGTASETDTALAVGATLVAPQPYAGPWTGIAPGWQSPTGQLTVRLGDARVVVVNTAAIGAAAETDTAVAVGRRKARTLGIAASTDTAVAVGRAKRRLIGQASTTDQALAISTPGHLFGAVGTAAETDLALAVGRVKTRTVGVATTTSAALAMGRRKTRTVGVATTTDVASPGGSTAVQRMPGILTAGTSRPQLTAGNSRPRLTVGTVRGPN